MSLIDAKGKLFGIVNILDLTVILFALFLVASVLINLFICEKPVANKKVFIITVLYKGVNNQIIENKTILNPGDKDVSNKAMLIKVAKVEPTEDLFLNKANFSDLTVLFKVDCVAVKNEFYLDNVIVKIGLLFTFSNPRYILQSGDIINCQDAN